MLEPGSLAPGYGCSCAHTIGAQVPSGAGVAVIARCSAREADQCAETCATGRGGVGACAGDQFKLHMGLRERHAGATQVVVQVKNLDGCAGKRQRMAALLQHPHSGIDPLSLN
jgi:hypothetical protein